MSKTLRELSERASWYVFDTVTAAAVATQDAVDVAECALQAAQAAQGSIVVVVEAQAAAVAAQTEYEEAMTKAKAKHAW